MIKAMIIDDLDADQYTSRRALERSGLVGEILSYYYADEALEYFRGGEKVDVIFLDINLPRMDGFEFLAAACREFGEAFVDIVVVMLTTSLDEGDQKRAREFKVVKDFRSKPLTSKYIGELINSIKNT